MSITSIVYQKWTYAVPSLVLVEDVCSLPILPNWLCLCHNKDKDNHNHEPPPPTTNTTKTTKTRKISCLVRRYLTFKWLLTSPYGGIMCSKLYDLWVAERLSCPPLTAFAIKVNPPWGIYDSSYHFAFYSGHRSPHKLSNCILECSFNKSFPNFPAL